MATSELALDVELMTGAIWRAIRALRTAEQIAAAMQNLESIPVGLALRESKTLAKEALGLVAALEEAL